MSANEISPRITANFDDLFPSVGPYRLEIYETITPSFREWLVHNDMQTCRLR